MLIGLAVARYHVDLALAMAVLMGLVTVMLVLSLRWVGGPIDRLLDHAGRLVRDGTPTRIDALPTHRGDEIGQIAAHLQTLAVAAFRGGRDAKQLRRTLDARVQNATRKATLELERIANRDPLTSLGNRRFFDAALPDLFESARRSESDLIIVAIDMDHFKQVNDEHGHARGDELLIALASLLKASIRHDDLAVRLGGDEFVVLMPGCDIHRAKHLAERMCAMFRQQVLSILPSDAATCSLSVGIASLLRDDPRSASELLHAADSRLYDAKRAGRAAVVA